MRVCCFMVIEKGISLEHRDYLLGSAHSCLQITPSHNQLWGGEKSPIKVHFWHFLTLRYRWPSNSFIIYSTVPAKLVITVMCAYRWKLYIYIIIYIYLEDITWSSLTLTDAVLSGPRPFLRTDHPNFTFLRRAHVEIGLPVKIEDCMMFHNSKGHSHVAARHGHWSPVVKKGEIFNIRHVRHLVIVVVVAF